ncbi:MAG: hypothetical protein JW908_14340 [Anaerolineales bacterium]|nr:hypothetical protein [Anaerolineales bacterium]
MSDDIKCPTKLIFDKPSDEDKFGAHQHIADCIYEMISSKDKIGGITIGIEGGYGSGKSTVINLLCSKFRSDEKIKYIFFDAWAHEGDPLRRTFLESIINSLINNKNNWINNDKWDIRKQELSRRIKTTTKTTVPISTKWGIIFAISILLIPIGIAILNDSLRDEFTLNFIYGIQNQWKFDWNAFWGIIFSIGPLSAYCLLRLSLLLFLKIPDRKLWLYIPSWIRKLSIIISTKNIFKIFRDSMKVLNQDLHRNNAFISALISKNIITDEQTQSIENPDPTSIEFEQIFCELMNDALMNQNDRKLIFILDNLDRINSEDARAILSTLQTFLQYDVNRFGKWYEQIWVIIPYDRKSLSEIWEKDINQGDRKGESSDVTSKQSVANAFLDKRFQIRFNVPPLLISDWHSYLNEKLINAMPKHSQEDFYLTYRVYDEYRTKKNQPPPTPRNIILFVNQLGVLHRQWQHIFPFEHMAYYVLLIQDDIDVIIELKNGNLFKRISVDFLGNIEEIRENFAAMSYGVDIPKARQILIRDDLQIALGMGDISKIDELFKYPKGFWEVLETITFVDWKDKERLKLTNAAFCFHKSGILEKAEYPVKTIIIENLRKAILSITSWPNFDENYANGFSSMFELYNNEDFASKIINKILSTPIPDEIDDSNLSTWIIAIIAFLRNVKSNHIADDFFKNEYSISINGINYIVTCLILYESDPDAEFWNIIKYHGNPDELLEILAARIKDGNFSLKYLNVVNVINHQYPTLEFDKVATSIFSRLHPIQNIQAFEIICLLKGLIFIKNISSNVDSIIDSLDRQGISLHYLFQMKSDPIAAALCIYLYLIKFPIMSHIVV